MSIDGIKYNSDLAGQHALAEKRDRQIFPLPSIDDFPSRSKKDGESVIDLLQAAESQLSLEIKACLVGVREKSQELSLCKKLVDRAIVSNNAIFIAKLHIISSEGSIIPDFSAISDLEKIIIRHVVEDAPEDLKEIIGSDYVKSLIRVALLRKFKEFLNNDLSMTGSDDLTKKIEEVDKNLATEESEVSRFESGLSRSLVKDLDHVLSSFGSVLKNIFSLERILVGKLEHMSSIWCCYIPVEAIQYLNKITRTIGILEETVQEIDLEDSFKRVILSSVNKVKNELVRITKSLSSLKKKK